MNMKLFILFIFVSLLGSCTPIPFYIKRHNQIINREIKRFEKEEKLQAIGGGGSMTDAISEVSLTFVSYKKSDVNEARRLCVKCIQEINQALNSDTELHIYLNPYPFPSDKTDISILFLNHNGAYIDYKCAYLGFGGVSLVTQIHGSLFYFSHNFRSHMLEPYYEEPYETALAIVRGELPETDEDLIRLANKEKYGGTSLQTDSQPELQEGP
jgi:hypothetical protein